VPDGLLDINCLTIIVKQCSDSITSKEMQMDLTFLGSSTIFWITALYIPVLIVALFTDFGPVSGVGRRIHFKFNALLTLRNLAAWATVQQAITLIFGVTQKLTQDKVWTDIATTLPMESGRFGSARLLIGGFNQGFGQVSGLSREARIAMSAQFALDMVTVLIATATVVVIAHFAYRSMPFASILPRLLKLNAVAVLVLQTLSQYVNGIARAAISHEVFGANQGNPALPQPIGLSLNFPMWQALVALGLFALAAIYAKGKLLQDDSEGLI
jgi:hypothetical protein